MSGTQPTTRRRLHTGLAALLLALFCLLINPLSALACGGLFSKDLHAEQTGERLIYALDADRVTQYEQFTYTGSPKDFVWVLPVPAVPTIDIASVDLFRELDRDTVPSFYVSRHEAPPCFPTNGANSAGSAAPTGSSAVHVYSGGGIGPYSYNVIGSNDSQALTQWLDGHQYKLSEEERAELKPYIAAKMLFLVVRLQGSAGVQDIAPVKITYATNQASFSIPLRLAAPMGKLPLGVTVWIFGKSRYVPQNYQSLEFTQNDFRDVADPGSNFYNGKVEQKVKQAGGHAFITEYAQNFQNMQPQDPQLQSLQQHYGYLTRLYTRISANQIQRDPTFVAQTGLSDVSRYHAITMPETNEQNCTGEYLMVGGALLLGVVIIAVPIMFFVNRRRKRMS